eukprot:TRINITY_DN2015_c0_g2_i4.p1 TRINITY_DN2015_c0_g2~~TRINITY_DN2015_c0_g2_i4.p1  ORF type:complete len:1315 (-),score=134.64 TRINITY_DN2015_c0_g2_i4:2332-5865(-)
MKNKEAVINGFLMVGLNYDSNVYADTGETQFGVPLFNINVTGNKEKEDYYNSNVIGVNHIKDIGEVGSWVWKSTGLLLNNNYRRYTDKNLFGLGITTGPSYFGKDYELYFPFSATKIWQGGKQYVNDISQGARWTRKVDQTFIFSAGYKYSRVFYENPNTDKDYMQHAFTLSATKFFTKKWNIALGAKLANSKGTRLKVATEGNTGNSETEGSINTTYQATDKLSFTAGALFRNQNYNEIDVFFGNTREDRYQSYSLSSLYSITDSSSIKASVADIQNHSNHGPYDYDKTTAGINYIMTFQGVAMKSVKNLLLIALLFAPLALHASIAKFSALSGDVSIIESGKSSPATMSSVIDKKDKIVTGESGKAQIVFKDNTVITLGINSDFAIEEYFSDAKKPKASFSIGKGTFKALTGAMGKINPDGFKLKTKTATIGIRGTGILGQVTPTENNLACTQGAITVTSVTTGDTVEVPAGSITTVTPNTPPTPPRAYTPEETGAIESESGVNEMPSDTQTQEESGGVEGGEAGATEAAAEEGTTEETATEEETTEEGTTEEGDTTAEEDTGTEGETTTEGDTATNEETTTTAGDTEGDALAGDDDVALPATTEALPEATNIGVVDSIAVGGITADDQTENFLQETAEALGVDVGTLTGELDGGLTLEDLEGIEEIIPEGTEGAGGETYTYADDRDVELYGIFGGGSHDEFHPNAGLGAYLTNTADASNSVWLRGYQFDVDIGVADPVVDEHFSFPRTPVSDTYVWYNSAHIADYTSADSSALNALFGSEINSGTVSTWNSGYEHIFFDSKQEFFVYHAVGSFEGIDAYNYKVEKVAVMGERSSWSDKPSAMYTQGDVIDGSLLKINYSNTRMLSVSPDNGNLVIGSVTDDGGYIRLNGNGYDGSTGSGYIFGSELQGYGVQTSDNKISAGYELLPFRSAPSYIFPSENPTLNGRAIDPSTDAGVAVSIDRTSALLGVNIGGTLFGEDDSQPSAYLDDGNFAAFNSSNNVFFTTGNDSYTTWGYWGTPSDAFSETRGYWIAGETTDTSYVQGLIDNMGTGESYRYVGWIDGAYYNGGSYVDKLGSSSSIDLKIYFGDGEIQANINMLKADNLTTIYSSGGYEDMTSESINNSTFSGNFDSTSGFLSGKYYGANADKIAGSIRHSGGTYDARGIFNADRQTAIDT